MKPSSPSSTLKRRHFLARGGALLTPVAFPFVLRGANGADAKNEDTLKLGLVGCGGRGTGAASQALNADYNMNLYAVADAFAEKAEASVKTLGDKFAEPRGRAQGPPVHRARRLQEGHRAAATW